MADRLPAIEPAACLGKVGGQATWKTGSEHFRRIAAMRKTPNWGRAEKMEQLISLACENGRMPFNTDQLAIIATALGGKVKMPCPSCSQPNKRQLMPDMLLLSFRPDPNPIAQWGTPSWVGPASGRMNVPMMPGIPTGPVQFALPCVVTVCMNCGYTEMYNVHVLGIGKELGVPDPGVPLG